MVVWDHSSQRRIIELGLYDKGLTGVLDVKDLTALTSLYCGNNLLSILDMGNLTKLSTLSCANNQLSMLDVGNLTALTSLSCANNQLSMLDVKDLTALTSLSCANNQLSTLDVKDLTALTSLSCANNQLSTLDVGNLAALTSLSCNDNPFTSFTATDGHTLTITPSTGGKIWLTKFDKDSNQVKLVAKPDTGYVFDTWSGLPAGTSSTMNIADFTLSRDETVAAVFRPLRTDATLKSLSLSAGTLSPSFDPAVTSYTATVGNSVSSVTITAGANDSGAVVTGDGAQALNVGSNTFTLTITAEDGSTKKEYTVTITRAAPDATLKSLSLSAGTLTPAFDPAVTSYTATVGNSVSSVTITAGANDSGAVVTGNGAHALNVGSNTFTLTVTAENGSTKKEYTVTIIRAEAMTPDGDNISGNGGSGSGSSSSHDSSPIITTPQPPKPNNPVLAVIELPVTVEDGTATGQPDDGRTASAIAGAQRNTKAKTNGIAVQYDAKTATAYDGFSITIKQETLDRLIVAKVKYVVLNTGTVDLTFDLAALGEIQKQATGDITLTATRETGLTGDALAAVGSRPAYRLTVSYTGKDGKAATVQDFAAGRVTVGLAYKPAATEQIGSLFLVYSADGKGAEWLYQSSYDRNSGNVVASTGHFSVYAVGYKPAPAFTDTVNHWAKADIDFAASRGLLAGTGDAIFTPDDTTTRGMFVVALGRLAGIDPAAYPSSRFTDVATDAYYAPYVEWAASKGIVTGTGEKTFSPDATITREQMAAIMQRYADKLGYTLPVAHEAEIFADEGQITSGMKNAVQAMQQAGVMNGIPQGTSSSSDSGIHLEGGHRFGPKDTATRAEAAAVLRRFVEIVIDPAAGGWGQNDAG